MLFSPFLFPESDLKPIAVFAIPVVEESSVLKPNAVLLVKVSTYPERTLFTLMINGFVLSVPMKFVAESIPLFPVKLHPLEATMVCQLGIAAVPIFIINWFFAVSKTSNPFAGFTIVITAAEFIRGIRRPFVPLLISSMALLSGTLASLFTATF